MENILCTEDCPRYIGVKLDKEQAPTLAKALQELLSIKAVLETLNAGSDIILHDFANEIEERAKRLE